MVDEGFFNGFHTYRLEWQPKGYLDFYIDGKLVFSVPQKSLDDLTGALIPVVSCQYSFFSMYFI